MFSKRVFVLGPSHHAYLSACALSTCSSYETPLGDLPIDPESVFGSLEQDSGLMRLCTAVAELRKTEQFSDMKLAVDKDEHSLEMHLPYIRKVFEGCAPRLFPYSDR